MFYTAATIAKSESFVLQKVDSIVFFAGETESKEAIWTSDKQKVKLFDNVVHLVRKARELNLSKVVILRELYQVIDVEVEQPTLIDEGVSLALS